MAANSDPLCLICKLAYSFYIIHATLLEFVGTLYSFLSSLAPHFTGSWFNERGYCAINLKINLYFGNFPMHIENKRSPTVSNTHREIIKKKHPIKSNKNFLMLHEWKWLRPSTRVHICVSSNLITSAGSHGSPEKMTKLSVDIQLL